MIIIEDKNIENTVYFPKNLNNTSLFPDFKVYDIDPDEILLNKYITYTPIPGEIAGSTYYNVNVYNYDENLNYYVTYGAAGNGQYCAANYYDEEDNFIYQEYNLTYANNSPEHIVKFQLLHIPSNTKIIRSTIRVAVQEDFKMQVIKKVNAPVDYYTVVLMNRATNKTYSFDNVEDQYKLTANYYSFNIDFSELPDDEYEYKIIYNDQIEMGYGIIKIKSKKSDTIYYDKNREYIAYDKQ